MRSRSLRSCLAGAVVLMASAAPPPAQAEVTAAQAIETYSEVAAAMYEDALVAVFFLEGTISFLAEQPTEQNFEVAKKAWRSARVPYQKGEGYRFGNSLVEEWASGVNLWPLDEGLIDYVDSEAYREAGEGNPLAVANVVGNRQLSIGGEVIDVEQITLSLISDTLHQALDIETNVARGFPVLAFLLWGADYDETTGIGQRPFTDYDVNVCSNENCDRRAAYATAAATLLLEDFKEMVGNWRGRRSPARDVLAFKKADGALSAILTGIGKLSNQELAGERIARALSNDACIDCFSGSTNDSHYYEQAGIMSIWSGRYERTDGSAVEGPSIRDYVAERAPEAAGRVDETLAATMAEMQTLKDAIDASGMTEARFITAEGDAYRQALGKIADLLVVQALAIESAGSALGLTVELGVRATPVQSQ